MLIQQATSNEDISKCWKVMKELRPHLVEKDFVNTVKEMFTQGYKLAFIEEDGVGASAVGYRHQQYLYNGRHIYIDDLTTLPEHRGKGHAGKLLDYVATEAKEKGYNYVTLDSGHQRFNAHRLYLNKGYSITSHHFSLSLE